MKFGKGKVDRIYSRVCNDIGINSGYTIFGWTNCVLNILRVENHFMCIVAFENILHAEIWMHYYNFSAFSILI